MSASHNFVRERYPQGFGDDKVSYLLSDHLGSTSVTANADGNLRSRTLYSAWGEVRYASGALPTDYTYTGQYSNTADFGLMRVAYRARWYDPYLNRFSQPDSIVPDPKNPANWDRYAYSANNPVRYIDPSGHDYYEPGCDCMVHTGENDKHLSNYDPGPYCGHFCGQPDPAGLSDDQIGDLDPVTRFILAWWAEPLDWVMTYEDCNQSQDCGWGTWALTLVPGAWGLLGKNGRKVALGLGDYLDNFAKKLGANPHTKWFDDLIVGLEDLGDTGNFFADLFTPAMNNADEIHFSLAGIGNVDDAIAKGAKGKGYTNTELYMILTNKSWFNKTTFYDASGNVLQLNYLGAP